METSPFAKLPAELNNKIFELALQHFEGIILCEDGRPEKKRTITPPDATSDRISTLLALTSTCKAIHAATHTMFYHTNTFEITHQTDPTTPVHILNRFRTWLTVPHAAAINTVVIYQSLSLSCYRRADPRVAARIAIDQGLEYGKDIALLLVPHVHVVICVLGIVGLVRLEILEGRSFCIAMEEGEESWGRALVEAVKCLREGTEGSWEVFEGLVEGGKKMGWEIPEGLVGVLARGGV